MPYTLSDSLRFKSGKHWCITRQELVRYSFKPIKQRMIVNHFFIQSGKFFPNWYLRSCHYYLQRKPSNKRSVGIFTSVVPTNGSPKTGVRTTGELCRKFGERILGEIVKILRAKSSSPDAYTREGVCLLLNELMLAHSCPRSRPSLTSVKS
jgi:hypothetical protein